MLFIFVFFVCNINADKSNLIFGQDLENKNFSFLNGYYINDDFNIWKLSVLDENNVILEKYSDRNKTVREWSPRNMTIEKFGQDYLLRNYFFGRFEFFALVYEDNGNFFLETRDIDLREEEISFSKRGEYKRYGDFDLDKQSSHQISDFINASIGMRYSHSNEIWMIKPLYPNIFLAKITIDENFKIVEVLEGDITYDNEEFLITLPSDRFYINSAEELFHNVAAHDMYSIDDTLPYHRNFFSVPHVGDFLYDSYYEIESYAVEENGKNVDYERIKQIAEATLLSFPHASYQNKRWIFNSDNEIIEVLPHDTQFVYITFQEINHSEISVRLDVNDYRKNIFYTAAFIFRKSR
jgi:hypothetical protein